MTYRVRQDGNRFYPEELRGWIFKTWKPLVTRCGEPCYALTLECAEQYIATFRAQELGIHE